MNLPVFVGHYLRGGLDLAAMAAKGSLSPRMAWVGLKGAAEYAKAVAAGDVADDATWKARIEACRGCPALTPPGKPGVGYCGKPFVEALDGPREARTCGCLVAGKASVASQACPRGHWEPLHFPRPGAGHKG